MSLQGLVERFRAAAQGAEFAEQKDRMDAALREAMTEAVSYARHNVPVVTGTLKDSIGYDIVGDTAVLYATAPHAPFVEYGTGSRGEVPTGPYVIEPKYAQALHFKVNGRDVFAKRVVHPGVRPRPFLRPAMEHARKVFYAKMVTRPRRRVTR